MTEPLLTITAAGPADLPEILALLRQVGLTTMGLEDRPASGWVARDALGRLAGCALLETYGRAALLRSVAVRPDRQGCGIGRALVTAALAHSTALGIEGLYLLTETAEDFFAAHGFVPVDRPSVPEEVRASTEFTTACPASAAVMRWGIRLAPPAVGDYN
jgi:amino-acid N-acetyltransferase